MTPSGFTLPPDDFQRALALARPSEPGSLVHLRIAGGTYTILLTGKDTNGRFCLIDLYVPPGGGPPPHRHDFEETFILLEGAITLTLRGEKIAATAGDTVNIPSNAPHAFQNTSDNPARMLRFCSPAGQDEFFMEVGVRVDGPRTPAPKPTPEEQTKIVEKIKSLAAKYRTELLDHA